MKSQMVSILFLSVAVLGFPNVGHTQSSLVNLNNWLVVTNPPPGCDPRYAQLPPAVTIVSPNSAVFRAGWAEYTNSFGGAPSVGPWNPVLVGNLATIPDATYEITCTLQYVSFYAYAIPSIQFGDFGFRVNLPATNSPSPYNSPVNVDFIAVAGSLTTLMSVNPWITDDRGGSSLILTDFSVTEVPEVSTSRLLGMAGVGLVAHQWRRWRSKA